jgi:hypothetical protein
MIRLLEKSETRDTNFGIQILRGANPKDSSLKGTNPKGRNPKRYKHHEVDTDPSHGSAFGSVSGPEVHRVRC